VLLNGVNYRKISADRKCQKMFLWGDGHGVRKRLVELQRSMAARGGVVMEVGK
jgi:hypothetical protein